MVHCLLRIMAMKMLMPVIKNDVYSYKKYIKYSEKLIMKNRNTHQRANERIIRWMLNKYR